ncbi:J domain-containing protein [Polynucleobacter sp. AP-Capit-er-40B-B4]|uniref:J domain-containing protein n=1 Tax=Polynucleobacter sp. AP-Capit-er-40B-B4 TaxID=2576927 RepID=UPI001C0CC548|nr:J domain-containing protein [Polynucleobacter sp. AP-Capit-er-40B-B4]MBU3580774.1 J domain-containing protein [Polynucleobacter sp. AP-Capit-er-40B-B4]
MSNINDPLGYYALLGVSSSATSEDIKKAYRQKAMDLHPDRNPGKDTTSIFQQLQTAYSVLGDPNKRSEYDTLGLNTGSYESGPQAEDKPLEPIKCTACGCITAQPRYAIFYKVYSYLVMTHKDATQGMYCATCAAKQALKCSAITWFFGWWGFPWGPLYSVPALFRNLLGGEQPIEQNAHILAYQAAYFYSIGKLDLARSVASEALEWSLKLQKQKDGKRRKLGYPADEEAEQLVSRVQSLLAALNNGSPIKELKNQWGFKGKVFIWQLGLAVGIIGSLWTWIAYEDHKSNVAYERSAPTYQTPANPDSSLAVMPTPESGPMSYLVSLNPNQQYPTFRVTSNSYGPNYVVKLVNASTGMTVMTGFARAGETVDFSVPLGVYKVKIASGNIWYGPYSLFGSQTDYSEIKDLVDFHIEGNQYIGHSLTLQAVRGGNTQSIKIGAGQF